MTAPEYGDRVRLRGRGHTTVNDVVTEIFHGISKRTTWEIVPEDEGADIGRVLEVRLAPDTDEGRPIWEEV